MEIVTISTQTTASIMVVEDNPADVELLREAISEVMPECELLVCHDGDEAMEWLENVADGMRPAPDLILLDLNLPGSPGEAVLEWIKCSDRLKQLPTVVLTTSRNPVEVRNCYRLHANSYVVKETSFARFLETIEHLLEYWFGTVERPRG